MFTIDEIFDYIHRIAEIEDDADINIHIHIDDDPADEDTAPCCANGCCRVNIPDFHRKDPPDMAFEFEDYLNDSLAKFGKKWGIVSPKDFERVCGVPASFIEAVDNGEAVKYLCAHK